MRPGLVTLATGRYILMATRVSGSVAGRRRRDEAAPTGAVGTGIQRVYAALCLVLVAYLSLILLRPAGDSSTLLDGWGVDAFELLVSGLCISSGLRRRTGRAVPLLLGAALTSWALGDFTLTIESLGGAAPGSPSVADAFYVGFFPIAYVALVLFVRGETRRLTMANWLDSAVAGLGAAALCAAFVFGALEHSTGQHSW
jgi:hypothetical protein